VSNDRLWGPSSKIGRLEGTSGVSQFLPVRQLAGDVEALAADGGGGLLQVLPQLGIADSRRAAEAPVLPLPWVNAGSGYFVVLASAGTSWFAFAC